MKYFFALFIIIYTPIFSISQIDTIRKSVSIENQAGLYLDLDYASAEISTWDKNEIMITGEVSINLGKDNEAFELKISKKGNKIKIESQVDTDVMKMYVIGYQEDGEKVILDDNDFDKSDYKIINIGREKI